MSDTKTQHPLAVSVFSNRQQDREKQAYLASCAKAGLRTGPFLKVALPTYRLTDQKNPHFYTHSWNTDVSRWHWRKV